MILQVCLFHFLKMCSNPATEYKGIFPGPSATREKYIYLFLLKHLPLPVLSCEVACQSNVTGCWKPSPVRSHSIMLRDARSTLMFIQSSERAMKPQDWSRQYASKAAWAWSFLNIFCDLTFLIFRVRIIVICPHRVSWVGNELIEERQENVSHPRS